VDLEIIPRTADHFSDVRRIYLQGFATGNATFEKDATAWERWNASHLLTCRLVARFNGITVGWAALSPVSSRCVDGGVGEVSLDVDEAARGLGVGKALLEALIRESEQAGLWSLQAGIFPENTVSIALHKECGFCVIGRRERIGKTGRLLARYRALGAPQPGCRT